MVNKIISSVFLFILILSLNACDKKPCCDTNPPETIIDSTGDIILLGNEGNFQWGNASLSYLDLNPQKAVFIKDIYKQQNQKNLGDVLQSMVYWNNKVYLVINNSGKIEILNPDDLKSIGSITGFKSPRYMLPISNSKAYVSDLYKNAIYVVDINSREIKKEIQLKGWTEEMLLFNNKLYVCNKENQHLFIVNTLTDEIIDSLNIGYGSASITIDHENKIWVSCSGKDNTYQGRIVKINPENGQVQKEFIFPMNNAPGKLVFNTADKKIYYQFKDLYRMETNENALPNTPYIVSGNKNIYSFQLINDKTFVSDAKDFVQASEISIYDNTTGNLDTTFFSGINTSSFLKVSR